MNPTVKENILSILSDELDTYRTMLAKTSQQIDLIRKSDMTGLQSILHEKDICISRIETIEKKIALLIKPSSQELFHDRDIISCLRDIQDTINNIIKAEENCYAELSALQADISDKILQSDKRMQATKAYKTSAISVPRFSDIRS